MGKQLLFLLVLLTCCAMEGKAQLLAGGEIYYELIGPKKYKLTAHVYRDCGTIPLNGVSGYVYGGTLDIAVNFTRTSIKKINDTCGNPCQNINNISNPGFEKHSFEATVDFNSSTYNAFITNGICFVNFAIKQGGRTQASTHDNGLFYIDAGTNICDTFIKKNHSPIFSMEPKFYAGCNQPFQYSPGPLDTFDHDSMAFSIEPIQKAYKSNISFKTGYSTFVPFTPYCPPNPGVLTCRALPNAKPPRGFYFDNMYFQVIFTPTMCDEKGYVNLRISEYRKDPVTKKMVLIGFTSREMLLHVRQVPDNNPTLIKPASGQVNVCSALGIMNITTTDEPFLPKQTKPDTTYIFWDKGYKSGLLNVNTNSRERTADLLLPGDTLSAYGKQYFTVAAYDKLCNASLATQTFIAMNYPPVNFTKSYTMDSCNIFRFQLKSVDSGKLLGGTATISSMTNQNVGGFIASYDSFTFNATGKFLVQYTVKNPQNTCAAIAFDTLDIFNAFPKGKLNYPDTAVCSSYIANLKFSPATIPGLKSFAWYKNDTFTNSTDSQWSSTIYKPSTFKLKLTDQNNCRSESRVHINAIIYKTDLLGANPDTLCRGSELSRYASSYYKSKPPLHYQWRFNGQDMNMDTNYVKFTITGNSKINVRLVDDNHCIIDDSLLVTTADPFGFNLHKSKEEICADSMLTVSARNISAIQPYSLLWSIGQADTINNDSSISRNFSQATSVRLLVKDAYGCSVTDSVTIKPVPVPKVSFPVYPGVCEGTQVKVLASFNPDIYPKTYEWKLDGSSMINPDSFYLFKGDKTTLIHLKASNRLGCSTEASAKIIVHPNPVPRILTDTSYNALHKIKLSTDKAFTSYQWFNGVNTRDNIFPASDLGAPGKYNVWCRVVDQNGCIGSDSVDIFTDKRTGVKDIWHENIRVYPNPVVDVLTIHTAGNCHAEIYSLDGQLIAEYDLAEGINLISFTDLNNTVYILKLKGSSQIAYFRIIKE